MNAMRRPASLPPIRRGMRLASALLPMAPVAAIAADAPPPAFNWAGLYLGASLGAGFPLNGGERLQAASGFTSPAFDLIRHPSRGRASRSARRLATTGSGVPGSGASRRISACSTAAARRWAPSPPRPPIPARPSSRWNTRRARIISRAFAVAPASPTTARFSI